MKNRRGDPMGYLLPIQSDTYTQYNNRNYLVKNHVSPIQPSAAIQLFNQEAKQNRQRFAELVEKKMRTMKSTTSSMGKGEYVNEFV